MKNQKLENFETDILQTYKKGEWQAIANTTDEVNRYANYAQNTLKKDKRVNIRMSEHDLVSIQTKAIQEGIPYQTLIASLIHKYISGILTERKITV